ncbi:MAG: glycoside hydrolase family 43 protein [Armatimonadota bacterium]
MSQPTRTAGTYQNPVYDRNFPDPFVLRFNGRYYAYATDYAPDGRAMQMLTSRDLVHWEPRGGVLDPLKFPDKEDYWAPEVAYSEGRFYLYYALGNGESPDHHLRVAVAEHPLGPWRDCDVDLTPTEAFAIDGHPFRDPRDGQWYLFYARDWLTPPFSGTGLVVDRLITMDRLAGERQEVLRPYADWQVFELERAIKGNLDWYTVEGPFVLPVGDRYCLLYSGGRWENPNYGVAYAFADHPFGPWVDDANATGPQVLRTDPGRVIGPGHNSVVLGPDLQSQWMVYHGWDHECTARYPRIDRLVWHDGRPACAGPTSTPQPAPRMPDYLSWFDEAPPGDEWSGAAGWERGEEGLQSRGDRSILELEEPQDRFVLECSGRATQSGGRWGAAVGDLEVWIADGKLRVGSASAALPAGFRAEAWHTLTVRRSGEQLVATLDECPTVRVGLPAGKRRIRLQGVGVELAHAALARRED